MTASDTMRSTVAFMLTIALFAGCPTDDGSGVDAPDVVLDVAPDTVPDTIIDATDILRDETEEPRIDSGSDIAADAPSPGECEPSNPSGLMNCVESDRYWADLVFIASERTAGSSHWQAVQNLCATRFDELGYTVERHDYGSGVNVIGTLPGQVNPSEQIVVSAHYDHISNCDGADDNATGVAGVLELARVLSLADFDRTLIVACWDEEETGLIGSTAYAERADEAGDDIVVSFVFDMIGYASSEPNSQDTVDGIGLLFPQAVRELEANESRGDFLAVLNGSDATVPAHAIATYGDQVGLPVAVFELNVSLLDNPLLSDFLRSDHAPFWSYDYPALLVSDTADLRNPYYHCRGGEDSVDTIDREFAVRSVRAMVASVAETLGSTVD